MTIYIAPLVASYF